MKDLSAREQAIVHAIEQLRDDIDMIQQPRSNFALEHFVVMTNDTPARQRAQTVLELQIKLFAIRRTWLDEREQLVEREHQLQIARTCDDEYARSKAEIEVERIDVNLAELQLARLGAVRESECLLSILARLPRYTREQFEQEEQVYWQKRLTRQALQDLLSAGNIGAGNREAIRQLTSKPGESTSCPLPLESLQALTALDGPILQLTKK